MAEPTPAAEGQTFTLNGEELTVGPSCGENHGVWYCVTHGQAFRNQFEKDGHIRKGQHTMAWGCLTHGPEVP